MKRVNWMLLASAAAVALLPVPSQACTVTAGGTGYPTIQAAVDAAPMIATIQVDGSTGACNENVLIPNVTLRMILSGVNGAAINGAAGSPTVDARVKGFMIQGFTITGGNRGIQVQRNANSIIDAVTVHATGGEGIVVSAMALAVITNSTIENNPGAGIKVTELASARVGANLPEDGGAAAPNTISGNGGDGISVSDKATAEIIHNTISGNAGNGISISASSSASTAGNLVNGNSLSGVAASERSFVRLGTQGGTVDPDATTAANGRFGVGCSGGAVVSGNLNGSNPLTGSVSQFGTASNAFDPSCPRPSTELAGLKVQVDAVDAGGGYYPTYAFAPVAVTVAKGDTVVFKNVSSAVHDVVWDTAGAPPSTGMFTPGTSASVLMPGAGTFNYHCSIHPYMTGTVTVNTP